MYDWTLGRFRAVTAALRRLLHEPSQGDVPMVKPWYDETTSWKVCKVGREMKAL